MALVVIVDIHPKDAYFKDRELLVGKVVEGSSLIRTREGFWYGYAGGTNFHGIKTKPFRPGIIHGLMGKKDTRKEINDLDRLMRELKK